MHYRSKTIAAWLALSLGTLGLHRLYLHGLRDRMAWLHLVPTAVGLVGAIRWLGLTIRQHQVIDADHAQVEFIARSRAGGGPATRLHEISHFVREDGRWYYVDGSFPKLAL